MSSHLFILQRLLDHSSYRSSSSSVTTREIDEIDNDEPILPVILHILNIDSNFEYFEELELDSESYLDLIAFVTSHMSLDDINKKYPQHKLQSKLPDIPKPRRDGRPVASSMKVFERIGELMVNLRYILLKMSILDDGKPNVPFVTELLDLLENSNKVPLYDCYVSMYDLAREKVATLKKALKLGNRWLHKTYEPEVNASGNMEAKGWLKKQYEKD